MAEFAECPEEMNMEKHGVDEKSIGIVSVQRSMPWEVYVDGGGQSARIRSAASSGVT